VGGGAGGLLVKSTVRPLGTRQESQLPNWCVGWRNHTAGVTSDWDVEVLQGSDTRGHK
jgi:hypothetical protein